MVGRRLATAIPGVIGVIVVTFLLNRALPGDPAAYFAGPAATPQAIEEIRTRLGLNRSLPEQFVLYIRDLARGDLGHSLTTGQPVAADLRARLPASLELAFCGLLLALAIALPLGVLAATRPGSGVDHVTRLLATMGNSLPVFFTGLVLVYVLYYLLGWAPPPLGRLEVFRETPPAITGSYLIDSLLARDPGLFLAVAKQLILPTMTLGLAALAPITRMTRAAMLGVLASDYVRTARANGLAPRTVLYVYALRNAMLPVVTTLGLVLSFLLGVSVVVEKIYAWPGIGAYALDSVIASDYAPVQGFVLTMAVVYVLLNLLIDLLYGVIDPRVQIES
ncbi:MAG: ABC transporter permease [bacterium]|nr:ABC transporter permease [bacterium]